MSLQVSILTPQRPFWDGQAEEIILCTESGDIGILKNHIPILTGLDVGAMVIRTKEEWTAAVILGGFAFVKNNEVTVLAHEAESVEAFDLEQVKKDFETAKKNLEKSEGVKERLEANFDYKRAKGRLQALKVVKKL